jgi:hypothetical protein
LKGVEMEISTLETSRIIRLPRDRTTAVTVVARRQFAYRYAYAPSADASTSGEEGEDYLVCREDDTTFVFVLCDGVTQSFLGGLGADVLGDDLMSWLWDRLPSTEDHAEIREALTEHLDALTKTATVEIRRKPLRKDLEPLHREVLDEKRAAGSESMFVCGRIDLAGGECPDGRLVLAWMGDSRIRLWRGQQERTSELGNHFHTAERWSTLHGPLGGKPHVYTAPLRSEPSPIVSVAAYSDGLALLDQHSSLPADFAKDASIQHLFDSPPDDISFMEIWLQDSRPAWSGSGECLPPDPDPLLPTGSKKKQRPRLAPLFIGAALGIVFGVVLAFFLTPSLPRPEVTLGEKISVILTRVDDKADPIQVTVDTGQRRTLWIHRNTPTVFEAANRIIFENPEGRNLQDQVRVVLVPELKGYVYPTDRRDESGRIVITREQAQAFLNALRAAEVGGKALPDREGGERSGLPTPEATSDE